MFDPRDSKESWRVKVQEKGECLLMPDMAQSRSSPVVERLESDPGAKERLQETSRAWYRTVV